ncbi:hypothetical protein GCM10010440_44940 [Kitasatospora cinereorecta]
MVTAAKETVGGSAFERSARPAAASPRPGVGVGKVRWCDLGLGNTASSSLGPETPARPGARGRRPPRRGATGHRAQGGREASLEDSFVSLRGGPAVRPPVPDPGAHARRTESSGARTAPTAWCGELGRDRVITPDSTMDPERRFGSANRLLPTEARLMSDVGSAFGTSRAMAEAG